MQIRNICLLLFTLLVCSTSAFAQQTFTLSGYVKEAGSKELLLGVTVYKDDKSAGTVSNNFGYYALQLPAGKHIIVYNFVGYVSVAKEIDISEDQVLDVNLVGIDSEIGEVLVKGSKTQKKVSEEVRMSTIDVPIKTIKDIPALMGEKDVLKVLQLMPGVQSGSEGQSGLYVRGGGPDQNLIILDGATVYNAQHLFGFFSLFNGDALRSVELIKGGFPARYGGRLSSVIDMNMKDGNKEKYTGELGIGVISSKGLIEGPIAKGKGSFIVSGRRTYIDALTQPIIRSFNDGNTAGYYFYDLNAKANYEINSKNRVYLSGYFGRDKFYLRERYEGSIEDEIETYSNDVDFGWGNATGTARWNHLFGPKLFSNTSLIYSFYELGISSEEQSSNSSNFTLGYGSGITDYTLKQDFDWYANNDHKVKFGLQATHHTFTPDALVVKDPDFGLNIDRKTEYTSVETGLYVEDEWKISNRLKSLYGLRLSTFTTNNTTYINPEPRISLAYNVKSDLAVKASYATMNQYVHLLSTSGVGLPTDLWVPATDLVKPQNSQQLAAGIAKDFNKQNLSLTVEGYYKTMNNIIGYKEGASFLAIQESDEGLESISWEDNVTSGTGVSYGAEVLLQRKQGKLTGWAGYTLSWTTQQFDELNNGEKFFARYDRRHDISLVGIYEFSDNITLSATWVYGTGNAITLPISTYQISEMSSVNSPGRNNFYWANGTEYTARNDFRMRAYHRADIGVQVTKEKKKGIRTWEFSAYNFYNRRNPFYYFIGLEDQFEPDSKQVLKQISLFPVLPSVSWNFKFN
ncbi:MAG: TonB-dependent receptor [Bacteroidia bacterium]|jgi:outer membrane receptor for ferrienterochelin and colicin